jgi:outer membrane protein
MENENIILNETPVEGTKEVKEGNSCENKKCRCCLNLILNVVAIIGVIVLFVLYFTGQPGSSSNKAGKTNFSISYINIDTIMAKYDLVKTMKETYIAKQKKASDSLEKLQSAYEYQVTDYQNKMKAGKYTSEQATLIEKGLIQQRDDLYALNEELTSKLSDENLKMTTLLQDSIENFLKRYNTKFKYDYIFSYSKSGDILYVNDSLEITKDVLENLNKEYTAKKKE